MKTTMQATALDLARRDFLKRVGTAATVAPAAALLLAASDKPAFAQVDPYGGANTGGFVFTIADIPPILP